MARQRRDSETARMTPFGKRILDELVDKVSTTPPGVLPVGEADLLGALVYAARRSPLEAVRANVGAYRDLEIELSAAVVVAGFLRHHAR